MIPSRSVSRFLLAGCAAAGILVSIQVVASPAARVQDEHHEEGPLGQAMNGLKNHLRKLAASLENAAGDAESLEHLADMQAIVLEAKPLDPSNLSSIPEGERAKHKADFRRDMARLLVELAQLEILVLDGDRAGALERAKGSLVELRNSSHDKFQEQ